jgi:glutamate N-acetyltransferase/amino-acid N-acetyltransferase
MTSLPQGFRAHVANVGIKDDTDDFVVIAADRPCVAAGLFTKSRFSGCSVIVSREAVANQRLQAMVVISKNANVATGTEGMANAREVTEAVARLVGAEANDILIASTGVIGRQYPMPALRAHLSSPSLPFDVVDAEATARAIMTTDTHPKVASATVGTSTIVGIAKGVGMIEPDMATLITLFFTDAALEPAVLEAMFRRVIDRTFNAVSIDTDTSTSDTAAIMASGVAGPVDTTEFEAGLYEVALALTLMVARDGEGATKLLTVTVNHARDGAQAKRVAKAIVNSPLVKTAVHGADPNWGRVAMAIGKCSDDHDIDAEKVTIRFGDQEVYPSRVNDAGLAALSHYMTGENVLIAVDLAIAEGTFTVYGCDLSDGYVRINADYTT